MVLCGQCYFASAVSAFRLTGVAVQELLSSAPFSRNGMTRLARQAQHFPEHPVCCPVIGPSLKLQASSPPASSAPVGVFCSSAAASHKKRPPEGGLSLGRNQIGDTHHIY